VLVIEYSPSELNRPQLIPVSDTQYIVPALSVFQSINTSKQQLILSKEYDRLVHLGDCLPEEEAEQLEFNDWQEFDFTHLRISEDPSDATTWKRKELIKRQW